MAKKEYVLAKKDIESLMHEKCTCKFCDPESESYCDWKTVWKQAFDVDSSQFNFKALPYNKTRSTIGAY